eukprot:398572-Amphidinium_carterae.1
MIPADSAMNAVETKIITSNHAYAYQGYRVSPMEYDLCYLAEQSTQFFDLSYQLHLCFKSLKPSTIADNMHTRRTFPSLNSFIASFA